MYFLGLAYESENSKSKETRGWTSFYPHSHVGPEARKLA
jgi:hypothetical protein